MSFKKYITTSRKAHNSQDANIYFAFIITKDKKRRKAQRKDADYQTVSKYLAKMCNVSANSMSVTDQAQVVSSLLLDLATNKLSLVEVKQ